MPSSCDETDRSPSGSSSPCTPQCHSFMSTHFSLSASFFFFLFVSECLQPLKLIVDLLRTEGIDRIPRLILDRARWRKAVGDTRMHSLTVVAGALLPASFF